MYIATFYTHYGAQSFYTDMKKRDPAAQMMPVPRALSASCGICVRFDLDRTEDIRTRTPEDLEGLYSTDGKQYETLLTIDEE